MIGYVVLTKECIFKHIQGLKGTDALLTSQKKEQS